MSKKQYNKSKLRVQTKDLEIPEANPFENDLLEREESVYALTNLLRSIESPCVFSIDAGWGNGKTTFLNIWSQFLRNEEFVVIDFNAWESDFSDDPFATLTGELVDGIKKHIDDSTCDKSERQLDEFKLKAKEVWQITRPTLIRFIAAGGLGSVAKILAETFELPDVLKSNKDTVKEFKESFQQMIESITAKENLPLVVMIDELDRCRPSYAIELLEVAKHLFSVNGVMFVLAVNHLQLSHSVKMLYGQDFDAHGYLKRFIDVDFKLPSPERQKFVSSLVDAFKINSNKSNSQADLDFETLQKLFVGFFSSSNLSLREIAKAVNRFGLVLGSLSDDQMWISSTVGVVLILRTINPVNFDRFCKGEITDLKFADAIFESAGASEIRNQKEGVIFENTVIFGALEVSFPNKMYWDPNDSNLFQHYSIMINNANSSSQFGATSDSQMELLEHAIQIRNMVNKTIRDNQINGRHGVGFLQSVKHLDFVTSTFDSE